MLSRPSCHTLHTENSFSFEIFKKIIVIPFCLIQEVRRKDWCNFFVLNHQLLPFQFHPTLLQLSQCLADFLKESTTSGINYIILGMFILNNH